MASDKLAAGVSRCLWCRQREHLEKTISDLRAQHKHDAANNSKRIAVALQVGPWTAGGVGSSSPCMQQLQVACSSHAVRSPVLVLSKHECRCMALRQLVVLQENKVLIQEISVLRDSLKELRDQLAVQGPGKASQRKPAMPKAAPSKSPSRALSKSGSVMSDG